ncbi:MAG: helix-turn-helix domain-containing protein [Clostridia bacterium]
MKKFEGNSNAYGKIIEKYRKNKNMSRADVSRELDLIDIPINPDELYRIEKQIMVLKDYELIAICMILGIDYNDLIKIIKKKK